MSHRKHTLLGRAHEIWTELDDAQRRLFEIRTGVPVTARSRRAGQISSLEDAFTLRNPGDRRHR